MNPEKAWIGVDFDGTLARAVTKVWNGPLGEPIPMMVARVKGWLAKGSTVKIFTARVCPYDESGLAQDEEEMTKLIERLGAWSQEHLGKVLDITNQKDHNVIEIWDDKVVQVIRNTGLRVGKVSTHE